MTKYTNTQIMEKNIKCLDNKNSLQVILVFLHNYVE